MKVFHGTRKDWAQSMKNQRSGISVDRGGGELGRGFYAGENIALAASYSQGKYGKDGKVLEIEIEDSKFASLSVHSIKRQRRVYKKWKRLLKRKQSHTYKFNFDVIVAPFATINFACQYKFESENSEKVLNGNKSQIRIL